ncbi:hypothetical protein OFB63_33195, partial [Escherichia coli]|nr:hypothetical protein [Escherichia coli]
RLAAESLRRDVEALASMVRGSAGAGERASAEWIAGRLRADGVADVRVEPFRGRRTYAWTHLAHVAAALLAARRRSWLLAAATLLSL